jgi:hypothetical protein
MVDKPEKTYLPRNSRDRLRHATREGYTPVNDQGAFRRRNTSERRKRKNAPYAPQLVYTHAAFRPKLT